MAYTKDTYKGKFSPKNLKKYHGDYTNIVYRSSYELRFMKWCDLNASVLRWSSEECVIPYRSPVDGKIHRYFVDFFIEVRTKSGKIQKYLVEVKPFRYTQAPDIPKRKSQKFITEVKQWGVNQAKWEAAKKYAKENGWEFIIITEKDLGLIS